MGFVCQKHEQFVQTGEACQYCEQPALGETVLGVNLSEVLTAKDFKFTSTIETDYQKQHDADHEFLSSHGGGHCGKCGYDLLPVAPSKPLIFPSIIPPPHGRMQVAPGGYFSGFDLVDVSGYDPRSPVETPSVKCASGLILPAMKLKPADPSLRADLAAAWDKEQERGTVEGLRRELDDLRKKLASICDMAKVE